MRIVLDTNVLISAIFWGGKPVEIIEQIVEEKVIVYATPEIMQEYFRLIEKFAKGKDGFVNQWKMKLMDIITVIETDISISDCRDPNDNMFLECAIASNARVIVSGDNDLLALHPYRGIDIIKVHDFLKQVQ